MKNNNKLLLLLIKSYKDWQGDYAGIHQIKSVLEDNKNVAAFHETVSRFKHYINSDQSKHPHRYVTDSYFFGSVKYKYQNKNFVLLNKTLDTLLVDQKSFLQQTLYTMSSVFTVCSDLLSAFLNIPLLLTNKYPVMMTLMIAANIEAICQEIHLSKNNFRIIEDNAAEKEFFSNHISLQYPDNYYAYWQNHNQKTCSLPTIPNFKIKPPVTRTTKFYNKDIYSKISISEEYSQSLTNDEIFDLKAKLYNVLNSFLKNSETARVVKRVHNSKGFHYKISNKLELSNGAAVFRVRENLIELNFSNLLYCDRLTSDLLHELHHADIVSLNSNNNPALYPKIHPNAPYEPFLNDKDLFELETGLAEGMEFIMTEFEQLYEAASTGSLQGDKLIKYNKYLDALVKYDYQPYCRSQFISCEIDRIQTEINAIKTTGYFISKGATHHSDRLYPTSIVVTKKNGKHGLLLHGYSVKNPATEKPLALIRDTYFRTRYMADNYAQHGINSAREITVEFDAEINSMAPQLVKEFFPRLHSYEQQYRQKVRSQQKKESSPEEFPRNSM